MCSTCSPNRLFSTKVCLPSISAIQDLDCIDVGKSGIVYALDSERVVKRYGDDNDIERRTERRAYDRLGHHPNIATFIGALEDDSIILERGEMLRKLLTRQTDTYQIPLHTKRQWIKHAAIGLQHVHDNNIIQSDVGCRNMIVVKGTLKLIDFEGCNIDDEGPNSSYEWFSYKPSTPRANVQTDIFALGCAIHEIMTNLPPYHECKKLRNPREHVEQLYERNEFPEVTDVPMGELIMDCWHGKVKSMSEVVERMEQM